MKPPLDLTLLTFRMCEWMSLIDFVILLKVLEFLRILSFEGGNIHVLNIAVQFLEN